MTHIVAGWDVDSPVQAEVFVIWLDGDRIQLTGPDASGDRYRRSSGSRVSDAEFMQ